MRPHPDDQQPVRYTDWMGLLYSFVRNPMGTLTFILAATGFRFGPSGQLPDLWDVLLWILVLVLILALLVFILWALPKTYHVILIWITTMLVSLFAMSWCLNYEAQCRTYFIVTAQRITLLKTLLIDFILRLTA